MQPQIYGLTGGIGVGKSVVAELFRSEGIPVLDADLISKELIKKGGVLFDAIVNIFGAEVDNNGKLDRRLIRKLVFGNNALKEKLEKLLHPKIMERAYYLAGEQFKKGKKIVLFEAAILIESQLNKKLDGIILVIAKPDQQRARASKRDDVTKEEIDTIIKSQLSNDEKSMNANYIIDNSGTIEETREQVKKIVKSLNELNTS